MSNEDLKEQIRCCLALYYMGLEAMSLLGNELTLMMWKTNQDFSHESKRRMGFIKKGMEKVKYGIEFFQDELFPLLTTDEGKKDFLSTSDALLKNSNQIVRTLCQMYNRNTESTKIAQEIIDKFNIERYENTGTNSSGDSEPK